MRPILLLCAAVSLLGLPTRAADRAPSPEATPAHRQIRIVPAAEQRGGLARVIVAGVSAPKTRESHDPRSTDLVTEIFSSTGERLAVVTDRPSPAASGAVRKVEAADGRTLPVSVTTTQTGPEPGSHSESPSSTVSWRGADGSLTTVAAYGDAAIELVAGPAVPSEATNDRASTAAGKSASPRLEFALLPIASNPVHGSTTVRFRLPESGKVTLDLFDPSGRRVSRLIDESRSAGEQAIPFRSQGLPPGRYYFRLTYAGPSGIAQHAATQSVVLLK